MKSLNSTNLLRAFVLILLGLEALNTAAYAEWPYCQVSWWEQATPSDFQEPILRVNAGCIRRFPDDDKDYIYPITNIALTAEELSVDAFSAFLTVNAHQLDLEAVAPGLLTALFYASLHQPDPVFVNLLIVAGAKLEAKSASGATVLHWAAGFNSAAVVEALLAAGVDKNERDKYGNTVLHDAVALNDPPQVVKVVRVLLEAGVDANAINDRGETVLHAAAWHSTPEVVRILLRAGVNKRVRDKSGKTAQDIAQRLGHNKIARILGRW